MFDLYPLFIPCVYTILGIVFLNNETYRRCVESEAPDCSTEDTNDTRKHGITRMHNTLEHTITFGGSAIYRIRVRGTLSDHWSDNLGGMRLTRRKLGEHEYITELVGRVRDQAALAGVLTALYDLHLPLLSVTCVENDPEAMDSY